MIIRPLNYLREIPILMSLRRKICRVLFKNKMNEVQRPANLQLKHGKRFVNNYYLLQPLKVLPLKDHNIYMTTYLGIVFNNYQILPESIHGKWDKRNVILLKDYYQMSFDNWLNARHGSKKIIELSGDKKYLLTHHWFNFYHWLTETVLRIWVMREKIDDYTLLFPESFKGIQFVQQSLYALGVKNIQYLAEGTIVKVRDLTLVQNKPYCGHYYPEIAKQIGEFFSDFAKRNNPQAPNLGDKIFISRKKAERRKFVNEDEVEQLLTGYGFKLFSPEDHIFFEQIALMSKAKYFVGMHGAGLTNMQFMPAGGKVLELHRELYSRKELHSDIYWKLADALNHDYFYQFCEPASKEQDFFTVDLIADIPLLKRNVERMLS